MSSKKSLFSEFFHSLIMLDEVDCSLLFSEQWGGVLDPHSFLDVLSLILSWFGLICYWCVRFSDMSSALGETCFQGLSHIEHKWCLGVPRISYVVLSWTRSYFISSDSHVWNVFFGIQLEFATENCVSILLFKETAHSDVIEALLTWERSLLLAKNSGRIVWSHIRWRSRRVNLAFDLKGSKLFMFDYSLKG